MTDQQPITPPQELTQQWINEEDGLTAGHIATRAAQWGWDQREPEIQAVADQELEACLEWLNNEDRGFWGCRLRAARRPKPPSLKQQALLALSHLAKGADESMDTTEAVEYIRRALEALPDD